MTGESFMEMGAAGLVCSIRCSARWLCCAEALGQASQTSVVVCWCLPMRWGKAHAEMHDCVKV